MAKRRPARCPTPRKRRFRSEEDARWALSRIDGSRSTKDMDPVRYYHCHPGCGGYHLTSRTNPRRRP